MAFEVFRDQEQAAGFTICVVTIPLCIFATGLRFVGTLRSSRKIQWEDWFALLATVFHLVYTGMFLFLLTELNGKTLQELALEPPEKLEHIMKVGWVMTPQYAPNQLFAKLSLCLLYYRLFSSSRPFVIWLYVIGGLQVAWFIAAYLVKWFLCVPVEKVWRPLTPGSCMDIGSSMAGMESVNSLLDFVMIGLAIWIIQSLRMRGSVKWKLAILFSIGGLSGVVGIIKVVEAYEAAFNNVKNPIWDIVQMATSVICCCAPVYKSIMPQVDFTRIRSAFSSYGFSRSTLVSNRRTRTGDSAGSKSGPSETRSRSLSQKDTSWMRLGGGEETTWGAEVSSGPGSHRSRETNASGYPMKTMEVRQKVESA